MEQEVTMEQLVQLINESKEDFIIRVAFGREKGYAQEE